MALADVCGFNKEVAFGSLGFQSNDFEKEMFVNSKNLQDGMVLAAPPFEDVSVVYFLWHFEITNI